MFVDQEEKCIQKPVGRVILQQVGSNSLWPANSCEDSETIENDVRAVTKAIDGTEEKQVHFVLDHQVQTRIDDKPAENDALEISLAARVSRSTGCNNDALYFVDLLTATN
jgi:hypothetical protein